MDWGRKWFVDFNAGKTLLVLFDQSNNAAAIDVKKSHFLIFEGGLLFVLIGCMIFLSPFLDFTRMSMSTVSFFAQLGSGILCLQNAFL